MQYYQKMIENIQTMHIKNELGKMWVFLRAGLKKTGR